jgi:hypothetical protein
MAGELHRGQCFCGAVEIAASGSPEVMGYCHCTSCRAWAAAPVNAFTLWKPENVKVVKGADKIGTYRKNPSSDRKFCRDCGGHVMTVHEPMGMVDVYAAVIPDLAFAPQLHVHYAESVLPMKDGLPKFKDMPAEVGGSGETVPE